MSQTGDDEQFTGQEVAIVGMAGRFPGARDLAEFWSNLRAGVDGITRFTEEELVAAGVPAATVRDPAYVRAGGVLAGVEMFDAEFFGLSPRDAVYLNPQHRLFLECAWEALEQAGYDPAGYAGRIGLFSGADLNGYWKLLASHPALRHAGLQIQTGNASFGVATRTSFQLGLEGPSLNVQTACSSSLVAVHLACQSLLSGESDMVLAGGVSVQVPQVKGYRFEQGGILDPTGACRSYDADARGTVPGSGVGIVVLKRLADALDEGDTVHAVIRGTAVNNDGSGKIGYTAPRRDGQARAIGEALAIAGVDPDRVSYVEGHGSATELGDPVEVEALTQVFRARTQRTGFCALGSVKSSIGHLDAAAGVAGLIKTVLALENAEIPPTLHFQRPSPKVDFARSPFYVSARLSPWDAQGAPRIAGVSSFGMGGTNAHVVLEEAPPAGSSGASRPLQLLVLSARDRAALEEATDRLARHLREHPDQPLADVAHTLRVGRRRFAHRRVLVCRGGEEAAAALESRDPARIRDAVQEWDEREVVFLLPGLGDHYAGMARGLYEAEPVFRAEVDRCAEILLPRLGLDLRDVLFSGEAPPEQRPDGGAAGAATDLRRMLGRGGGAADGLARTELAHPAVFVVEYALARLWTAWGLAPAALLGHSLGEYVAATLAGVFELEDALALVAERARLVAELPAGAMLAVPMDPAGVEPLLGAGLALAAHNAPGLCTVSGTPEAVAALEARLLADGVACRRLNAGHAFHSPLMEPVAERLAERVRRTPLRAPSLPFLSNVTGGWITPEEATDPAYWTRHLCLPVRFAECLRTLLEEPGRLLLEVGPGRTLGTFALAAGAAESSVLASLRHAYTRQPDAAFLLESLGRSWLAGARVDWDRFADGERRRRVPLPTYPFQRQRFWVDAPARRGPSRRRRRVADGDSVLRIPAWRRAAMPPADDAPRTWVLLADGGEVGAGLAAALRGAGHRVVEVAPGAAFERAGTDAWRMRPERGEDFRALGEALERDGTRPEEWVHLWTLTGADGAPDDAAHIHPRGYAGLVHLARTAGTGGAPARITLVADRVFDVGGVDAAEPARAMLLGPLEVIPREYPALSCRIVDVATSGGAARLVETLAAELRGGSGAAVALRGWKRWTRSERPLRPAGAAPRVRGDGFYLLGGRPTPRALAAAAHLAGRGAKLLLLEGGAFPEDRAEWDPWLGAHDRHHASAFVMRAVRRLEAGGAEVLVLAADAQEPAQVERALARARERWGPLRGVVHTVEVGRTRESVPLRTFVPGPEADEMAAALAELAALERVLAGEAPDFCLVQSAPTPAAAGSLRMHQAAAAEIAAAFARRHAAEHRLGWTAVRWDFAHELDDPGAEPGAAPGWAEALERVLALDTEPQVRVAPRREAGGETAADGAAAPAADASLLYSRPALATPYAAPGGEVERRVAEAWQDALGIGQVGVHDDFFSLGGHSLFATQIISRLRDAFRVELSLASLFEAPTVAGLARRIEELRAGAPEVVDAPVVPVPHDRPLPLSFQQQRIWLLQQMEPGNPFYNVPISFRFRGAFDTEVACRALNMVARRHAILRTVYRTDDAGEPVQVILPEMSLPLPLEDLRHLEDGGAREAEARRLALAEAARPFDVTRESSYRARLVRLDDEDWVMLTTFHHLALDGWSGGIFYEEWYRCYAALVLGEEPRLPELPVQYADFAVWQRTWLSGERLRRQVDYWKERLEGAPLALEVPTDRVRPPLRSYRGAQHRVVISAGLKERLEALCAREGITLFILLMAAYKVLLRRYSGQDDLVVGTVDANRSRPETEPLIGFFINTLPIRTRLDGDPTLAGLFARVRDATLGAYARAELPLEKLLEELHLERDVSRNPLIQVMFGFERPIAHFADPSPRLPLRAVEYADQGLTDSGTAKFDLDVLLREHPEEGTVVGILGYNLDLFDPATTERLLANYFALLEGIAADPERRVSQLEVMSPRERRRVLAEFNDTARPFPAEPLVHERFADAARRTPDAAAVLWGAERVPYAALDARANQVARALRRMGVGPETPVGACVERGPEMLAALLGILRAGGAFVPLDPAHPDDRIARVLRDAGAPVLLAQERLLERLAPLAPEVLPLDGSGVDRESADPVESGVGPANLAYVIYTSGSTGEPKGVRVEHRALLDTLLGAAERFGVRAGDVMPSLAGWTFDIWLLEALLPLLAGGAVRVVPAEHVTDMDALAREAEDATLLHAVPALMRQLAGALAQAGRALPGLRAAFTGGDAVPPDLPEAMRAAFPAAAVHVLYGPTEGVVICTAHHAREVRPERHPLGTPLPNTRVYVCDAAGAPLPLGVPGELLLGGAGLARGYGGLPGLTAERFVPDALCGEAGGRLYRTGDRARWRDDGTLEFLGRTDAQVKLRGFRIEPGEVEAALLRHGGVAEAVVAVRGDGPGEPRLVAWYTAQSGVTAEELRGHLRGSLPEYMVPSALVALDRLPLTPTGKVDRAALVAPAPADAAAEYVAPRGPVEEALAEVWRDVLGLDRVGVHDNFFALGGDSILSIQAVSRARRAGVELKPRHFFENPTIAELAPLVPADGGGPIAEAGHGPAPFALAALEPDALGALLAGADDVEDAYPLTPMQEGMLFHSLYAPGEGGYVGQYVFSLAGEVDAAAFRRAWQGAVDRHPALRTDFAWEGLDRPLQRVRRGAEVPFLEEDWRGLPAGEQAARLDAFLAEDRARGFDPARAPLMRLAVFRLADDLHRVAWTHHHLVTDGWSLPLLFRDVVALYDGFARGTDAELGAAPPYRDYVAWLQGRDLAAAERFWRGSLAGFAAPTPLEIARPAAPAEVAHGYGRARMELADAESAALGAMARRHQLTAATLVQGAWALLLSRYGGGDDVLFGAVVSGRPGELAGVEEMVGLFINTVPVRVPVRPDANLADWLAELQRRLAAAREHAYTPLVQVRAWTEVPAARPLFESIVVFQNQPMDDVLAGGDRRLAVRDLEGTEQADLPLTLVAALQGRLRVEAEFQRERFDPEAIGRMLGHLRVLLEEFAAGPERRLGDVELLAGAERRRVLEEWSGRPAGAGFVPVHEAFAARARENPDATAVLWGAEPVTYGELDARAGRLAEAIRLAGAGPEARVAVYTERGPDAVAALLAALRAGCAFVPLDPAYRSERLAHMLRDSGAAVLVTQASLRAQLGGFGGEVVLVDEAPSPTRGEGEHDTTAPEGQEALPQNWGRVASLGEPGEGAEDAYAVPVDPDRLAYVVYTSGSTGTPKGVAVPHGALAAVVDACVRLHGIGRATRLLQAYSLSFDPGVLDVFMALATGATLVVAGREDQLSGERLAELVRSHAVTAAALPPALLGAMPDDGLPTLRTVIAGGEACPPETVARWSRGRRFFVAYGPTETTVVATALEAAGPEAGAPIGRPLPGVRVFVADGEGRPVPAGVPGELWIGGMGVARGYLGRPEPTAAAFVPDALSGAAGARLYRTGDRVRWRADGALEFLGRVDLQVKVRGFRIEPGEVEAVLTAHPAVRDAVVEARGDAPGERRLVAYVTPSGGEVPVDGLRVHARERLPEHMVPAAFVVLDALPLTPGGKVDRRALPAPEGAPDPAAYVAPRTPVEALLADIVADVLGLERVGVHDGFFDIGGHSLLATRVVARIHRALGVDVPLRAFFAAPTVAGIAEHLAAETPVAPEAEDRLEDMLGRLEELSDEEVMRLLGK